MRLIMPLGVEQKLEQEHHANCQLFVIKHVAGYMGVVRVVARRWGPLLIPKLHGLFIFLYCPADTKILDRRLRLLIENVK